MMHKLNDELLEKVTGGVGFDYDAMSPEDRARYEELHKQYLQICYDYGNTSGRSGYIFRRVRSVECIRRRDRKEVRLNRIKR